MSKSTVAYALKGVGQCAQETQERIKRLAKEMGYLANPLVAAHLANVRRSDSKTGYAASLAYLSDRPKEDMLAEGFTHAGAFEGALERANEMGYQLEVFYYEDPELSWDRLKQILKSRSIHGVLIGPHRDSNVRLGMGWDCFSTVIIGDSIVYPKYHCVGFDHLGNMELLCERLSEQGRVKVGFAVSEFIDNRVRRQFRSAFELFRDQQDESLRVPAFVDKRWDRDLFLKWYGEYKPDVIVTVYDDVRRWLASVGIEVPRDVGIVTPAIMADSLEYSGMHLSLKALGRLAVETVTAQLFRNERGIPAHRCTGMVVGESWQGVTLYDDGDP